jgi:hypothetical protein
MATSTFDELFSTTDRRPEVREPERAEQRHWFTSWEEWLSLTLVLLLQVPVIGSLESANWVNEMPSLAVAAGLGVAAGWLLAQSSLRAIPATVAGIVVAFVSVMGLVLYVMERVDFELGEGFRGLLWEFWLRLRDWGAALIDGGISTDPLPFVVLMVAVVFTVAYLSSWAVVRWRNPWAALIPGGVVLLTNISYLPGQPSLAFILYVFAAVLLVTRLHLLRSLARWRQLRMNSPEGMSLEVLGVATMVAIVLILFAWLVPTANHWGPVSDVWNRVTAPVQHRFDGLGNLFIGISSKKPLPIHAYGATLPIQGRITLDRDPMFEVFAEEPGLLRGAVYDEYTGTGWRMSESEQRSLPGIGVDTAQFGTAESRASVRRPIVTEIAVIGEGGPDAMLLVPGDPLATDAEAELLVGGALEPLGLVPHRSLSVGDRYTTVGSMSAASALTLHTAGTEYPASLYGRYTQLPSDLPPEINELAQSIVSGATSPYEAALRMERYLRQNYTFTLEPAAPLPRRDAVSYFLFDEQQGYFDHFASSMAVMLRSVGIPSRVAVGFVLEERDLDPESKAFIVTEQRAWAWTEVYFPEFGWVEFNPTPGRPPFERPGDDSEALEARDAVLGGGEFIDDFLLDDFFLELLALEYLEASGGHLVNGEAVEFGEEEGSGVIGTLLTGLVVVAAAVLAVLLIARFLWERAFRGLPPAMRRWGKVQRLSHWAGLGAASHRTPVEAAQDLAPVLGQPVALRALAQDYTRARYGQMSQDEPQTQARERDEQYRLVRGRLWPLVLRRIVLFGRVSVRTLARRDPVAGGGRG